MTTIRPHWFGLILLTSQVCACGGSSSGIEDVNSVPDKLRESGAMSVPQPSTSTSQSDKPLAIDQTVLSPSACVLQYRPGGSEGYEEGAWPEVVMPDGSIVDDFSSTSAAQMVQGCFYQAGLVPDDEMVLYLIERVLWNGPTMVIARTGEQFSAEFEAYGGTWSAPVIERQDGGFVARFQGVELDLDELVSVVARVTPTSVEFEIEVLGNPGSLGVTTN